MQMANFQGSMDKLDELRLRYWHSLPQKADDLFGQWQRVLQHPDERAPMAEFQQQVHRLSGSAPAYGFDEVGALARPLDQRLAEWLRGDDADARPSVGEMTAALAGPVAALIAALRQAAGQALPPA